ncbi:hypothetical protein HK18_03745 [Commensalibacter intestini]|uniref:Endonuclease GajA/Old nuclease/RecF-like AAA domain-containing protein n=1 Tax=Commensalibacter intestini TaxID=479936 RepID=A0A251ZWH6_9PROT|nr:AAA family ATPase [Commensalibacter intestini]OUI79037.1 hypothetical protein HK18_03745 [Commensalibacter intestini]
MSEALKLDKIEIKQLFNRFNYTIDLVKFSHEGFCILTAPNGYGKTTILKLIRALPNRDFSVFFNECYEHITFCLNDNTVIKIKKDKDKDKVNILYQGKVIPIEDLKSNFSFRESKTLRRIGKKIAFLNETDDETDEEIGENSNLEKFILQNWIENTEHRKNKPHKEIKELEDKINSLKIYYISTNRLNETLRVRSSLIKNRPQYLLDKEIKNEKYNSVESIAYNIKSEINAAQINQFEEGRSKESNFPKRILDILVNKTQETQEDNLQDLILEIQQLEEKYSSLGLIPNTQATRQLDSHLEKAHEDASILLVLKTYLSDIKEKFALLSNLANKLDIFQSSVNSLLSFKRVKITAEDGLKVYLKDKLDDDIPLKTLSSGEQHLLTLIGCLIFQTKKNDLILIDEPEISFHPQWQERFVDILSQIRSNNDFNVIISTHSPILIGIKYWDSVIELREQCDNLEG